MSVRIRTRARRNAAVLAVAAALVASLSACSQAATSDGPGGDVPYVAPSTDASAANDAIERAEADAKASAAASEAVEAQADLETAAKRPEEVRDAFAGLQATLDDTCTPGAGDCAYFLGRVHEELTGLDRAMKVDDGRPNHFKEPLGWLSTLWTGLAGDISTANLEKHFDDLTGTRDRINTWMQGHPEDYR
ncbi:MULTISPECIES: hypothetical protein [unclassified Streptomyces]|uniref:hypothetical protein n=1 Tax=unclassified Streptomyces TaxID=2593676 RepID=UPI002DD922FA|nr:hypothetical protein [Streptomyces sp. NBC_01257]WRZ65054.1 hypothetical protein OG408_14690 [Streptomyces sp. NBC_01257]